MSFRTHASFLFCIIASCLVRSSLAGDSIGAQVQYDAATGAVLIDWEALPEHYYFLEQTGDLTGSFATAKLFKDLDGDGQLSTGLNTNADSAFFRFTYTDDQNDAMLRADDDGDRIINLLEADAGMDAFEGQDLTDTDGDLIPDYFEQFHVDTLEHDGDYVATSGGLSVSEAYENATDPNALDSDGDGWTDSQELSWNWDANYDQSRDASIYSESGDYDGDGYSNSIEASRGTNPISFEDMPPWKAGEYKMHYTVYGGKSQVRYGASGYLDSSTRYLTKTYSQSVSGGCDLEEHNLDRFNGSEVTSYDKSGQTTIERFPDENFSIGGTLLDPSSNTQRGRQRESERVWEEWDEDEGDFVEERCSYSITGTYTLSGEYTVAAMIEDALAKPYEISYIKTLSSDESTRGSFMGAGLSIDTLRYGYSKADIYFRWEPEVAENERYPITKYLVFIPSYNYLLPGDERDDLEIFGSITWNGESAQSYVISIEPDDYKPDESGSFDLINLNILPDYDRSGYIDLDDYAIKAMGGEGAILHIWSNDDNDISLVSGDDTPNQTSSPDYGNQQVDTMRDLVDWFPIQIDLGNLEDIVPEPDELEIRLSGSSLNLADYYDITLEGLFYYEYDNFEGAEIFGAASTTAISSSPSSPTPLGSGFYDMTAQNEGRAFFFVEGVDNGQMPATEPLIIHIYYKGREIFQVEQAVRVDHVENMYHHVDLTGYTGDNPNKQATPAASANADAPSWPDDQTNGKTFVFIHGYNVDGQAARGWNAEIFKRMHQLGSNARFVGVTWDGDVAPDYHNAVYRAFQTSAHVTDALSGYSNITIAAHSLGNMVISNAMEYHSFNPDRYCLLNAAVAIEAYNATQTTNSSNTDMQNRMTENDWKGYPDRLYASNWYNLFDASDDRGGLTWKDRFSNVVDKSYNFYSPGEDVVENANASESFGLYVVNTLINLLSGQDLGEHAWVAQEIAKGNPVTDLPTLFKNVHGGWSFNLIESPDLEQVGIFEPDDGSGIGDHYRLRFDNEVDTNTPTDEQLAQFGFFKKFDQDDVYGPLNDTNQLPGNSQTQAQASSAAGDNETQWHLLAEAIPAMSYAAAANPVEGMQENFNMQDDGKNGWPASRGGNPNWLHSDFKNISLNYVSPMYKRMIDIGELNDE